jgi:hypothetical protein
MLKLSFEHDVICICKIVMLLFAEELCHIYLFCYCDFSARSRLGQLCNEAMV